MASRIGLIHVKHDRVDGGSKVRLGVCGFGEGGLELKMIILVAITGVKGLERQNAGSSGRTAADTSKGEIRLNLVPMRLDQIKGQLLSKWQKLDKSLPNTRILASVDLLHATTTILDRYKSRLHPQCIFRLTLPTRASFLFESPTESEAQSWVVAINAEAETACREKIMLLEREVRDLRVRMSESAGGYRCTAAEMRALPPDLKKKIAALSREAEEREMGIRVLKRRLRELVSTMFDESYVAGRPASSVAGSSNSGTRRNHRRNLSWESAASSVSSATSFYSTGSAYGEDRVAFQPPAAITSATTTALAPPTPMFAPGMPPPDALGPQAWNPPAPPSLATSARPKIAELYMRPSSSVSIHHPANNRLSTLTAVEPSTTAWLGSPPSSRPVSWQPGAIAAQAKRSMSAHERRGVASHEEDLVLRRHSTLKVPQVYVVDWEGQGNDGGSDFGIPRRSSPVTEDEDGEVVEKIRGVGVDDAMADENATPRASMLERELQREINQRARRVVSSPVC
ncbi:hypothetical protein HDU96_007252 [Phlyctochytrium bullatum]|nr:hypothetical protein HDU96_007252 [Phlyctochytrium bullatum]